MWWKDFTAVGQNHPQHPSEEGQSCGDHVRALNIELGIGQPATHCCWPLQNHSNQGWEGSVPQCQSTAHRTESRKLHTLKELRVYKRTARLMEVNIEYRPDQRRQVLGPAMAALSSSSARLFLLQAVLIFQWFHDHASSPSSLSSSTAPSYLCNTRGQCSRLTPPSVCPLSFFFLSLCSLPLSFSPACFLSFPVPIPPTQTSLKARDWRGLWYLGTYFTSSF